MIDHMGFGVADMAKSKAFYEAALAPLGIRITRGGDNWASFSDGTSSSFWIGTYGQPPGHIHFAFVARDREAVRAFHAAAIKAGGRDNGFPGIREQYSANYYAAFVIDPDGHNVEAVCRAAE